MNPKSSSSVDGADLRPPASSVIRLRVLDGVEHAVGTVDFRQRLAEVSDSQRRPALDGARGRRQLADQQLQHRRLAGAVDADESDPHARARSTSPACPGWSARRPRGSPGAGRTRPCPGVPSRSAAATRESRGSGSLAIRSLAAWMRNFGFDVRAGGPRRSHASSLRIRLRLRASVPAATRIRSARAST